MQCAAVEMVRRCDEEFTEFYMSRHSGRKLTWLHEWSTAELTTNCFSKPYTFHVSQHTFAMTAQTIDVFRITISRKISDETNMSVLVIFGGQGSIACCPLVSLVETPRAL